MFLRLCYSLCFLPPFNPLPFLLLPLFLVAFIDAIRSKSSLMFIFF
jgi:hypothetical protein